MKIIRLTHNEIKGGGGASAVYDPDKLDSLLEEVKEMKWCEIGDSWAITVESMSRADFEDLPEFTGW